MKSDKTYRINGFEQIKAFYSWVFNNAGKRITPQHISLYIFLVNQNNRSNWVEWFKVPYDLAMAGACIGNKKTYYTCLAELTEWKLIEYEKGVNEWKAPLIKLEVLKCTSTDTATVPLPEPLPIPQVVPLPIPLPTHIYKQVTDNIQRITDNLDSVLNFLDSLNPDDHIKSNEETFETFRKAYPGSKRGLKTEFDNFRKKHKDWQTIIPMLNQKLSEQIAARELNGKINGFVPAWKNLQTWINQRCWEEEIAIQGPRKRNGSPASIAIDSMDHAQSLYNNGND